MRRNVLLSGKNRMENGEEKERKWQEKEAEKRREMKRTKKTEEIKIFKRCVDWKKKGEREREIKGKREGEYFHYK